MSSLFRPWAEDKVDKNEMKELTEIFPDSLAQKHADQWKTAEGNASAETLKERETKYKSVKEHMKKRSEKYWLKKLKVAGEKRSDIPADPYNPWNPSKFSEIGWTGYPASCHPSLVSYGQTFDIFSEKNAGVCAAPAFTYHNGGDLIETALVQGFSPNMLEDYARFLTEQQKQVADRSRKQRPKKFRCPHCQVGFSNNGQLRGHIRIHTGERPFKCDAESCGKSFTRNEELTRHRRIHSGLRPFPCSECGKRFGRKDHLKKHVKTHFQQKYQLVPILPSHCPYLYGL